MPFRFRALVVAVLLTLALPPTGARRAEISPRGCGNKCSKCEWPQWGGPHRDFTADVAGLADSWPPEGPRKLWSRSLGEGYSGVAVADGRLFTAMRRGNQEVVVALDAATGRTLWEYAYDALFSDSYSMENGPGPHATPLVVSGRVFAAGATGILHALNAETGQPLWSHDLMQEFHGTVRVNGYACSPLAWRDLVILQVGGAGHAVMAFRQADGSIVWQSGDFQNSPASPLLINVGGQPQLVAFLYEHIAGFDPASGALLWSHPHKTDFGLNVSTPVWGPDNLLFVSSGYNGGSRVVRLRRSEGKTTVEEVWSHRLMRVHFTNVVRVGDYVYGSSGDFGPAPFTALQVRTGQVAWRYRGLARASLLAVGGRFILLDEDGTLALATPAPEGLRVHSKVELLSHNSWTVPTLAGTTLYLRDRKNILALDLK